MAGELYRISREGAANVLELLLPPHMDSDEFDRLNDSILAVLSAEPVGHWIIDLSALSYIGSSFLGLMVNARQRVLEAGGRLAICGVSAPLMRIFTTCCLERLFVIRHTRHEAGRAIER